MEPPSNWLDLAASHSATKWIKQFILDYLPQLQVQAISPEQFALTLADELSSRKLSTMAQQKNYRSNVVQALKVLDPNHPAIALVSPTPQEYRVLNDAQRGKLADRRTRFFTSQDAQKLVDCATALLDSAEWAEVGAGLAVLIGRRISEILLSQFSLRSPWSLCFSEMAKKAELASGMTIEIPTLAPAQRVLKAIERLQKALKIEDLKVECLTPKMAKQKVNQRFSESVGAKCHEHFADLVPVRTDRDNLYTHVFRACYATIAAHWFCPPTVPEHSYKAEIQGHFSIAADGSKLPNFSARANYDDYAVGDGNGNRDGRLGIMLGQLPGLEIIEAFRNTQPRQKLQEIETMARKQQDQQVPRQSIQAAQEQLSMLVEAVPAVASEPEAATHSLSKLARRAAKPAKVAVQLDRTLVKELAQRFGFPVTRAKGHGYQQAVDHLLERLDSGSIPLAQLSPPEPEPTRVAAEPVEPTPATNPAQLPENQVASWFIAEIEQLRQQLDQLQHERDQAIALAQQAQHLQQSIQRLEQENSQLKLQAQRFESARLALLGGASVESNGAIAQPSPNLPHSPQPPVAASIPTPEATTTPHPIAPQTQPQPSTTPRRSRAGAQETAAKINDIIDAIIRWNTSTGDIDQMIRISIPPIKAIASVIGANYQPVIQQVLRDRQAELEKHHSDLLLGVRHNAGVRDKTGILRTIARDYLGVENWSEVKD